MRDCVVCTVLLVVLKYLCLCMCRSVGQSPELRSRTAGRNWNAASLPNLPERRRSVRSHGLRGDAHRRIGE